MAGRRGADDRRSRMPLDPSVLPDLPVGDRLAWAARLRAAADEVDDVARTVRRRADDAGLVGPAGDALQQLAAVVADEVVAAAGSVQTVADRLLAGAPR